MNCLLIKSVCMKDATRHFLIRNFEIPDVEDLGTDISTAFISAPNEGLIGPLSNAECQ